MAGAPDLRVRPALVRRVRDGGCARRPRRGVGRCGSSGVSDLPRNRRAARDRGHVVPPDGARVRDVGRCLHRRQGQPRPGAEPHRRGGAPDRLHPHRCGLGGGRRARAHLGSQRPARTRAGAVARVCRPDHPCEPPRRQGGGRALRAPDLRLRDVDLRPHRDRGLQVRHVGLPAGRRPAPDRRRHGRCHPVRRPARVRLRIDGADGRRGDRERRECVPPAARPQRSRDAGDAGCDRDCDVRRCVVARSAHARAAGGLRNPVGALTAGAGSLPGRLLERLHVLGRSDPDARRSRSRREHLVPGLPAVGGAARPRPVLRAAVHQPRRPARVLERDHRARDDRSRAPRHLQRERRLADPPLRDRGVQRVHAVAGRDGPLLAAHARSRLAPPGARQRRGGLRHRGRDADRDLDEVHGRRVARDRRDPAVRARLRRHQPPLPALRPPARRGRRRDPCCRQADQPCPPVGRVAQRRDRGGALVRTDRSPTAGRSARCSRRAGTPIRRSVRGGSTTRRPGRSWNAWPSTKGGPRRCSRRCGACPAASPTSSRS